MQLLKCLLVFGLLNLQSIAEPIHVPRDDLVSNKEARGIIQARVEPPKNKRTNVDIAEAKAEKKGWVLYTEGLKSCIAVVIRSATDVGNTDAYDKLLGHVSSTVCESEGNPDYHTQIQNIFDREAGINIPNREIFIITAPDNGNAAQAAFNNEVFQLFITRYGVGGATMRPRDQSHVDEPNGSRLWIDSVRRVRWGINGQILV